jgi:acetyl-CoA carboxylase carboxyl transferase subunit alpha
MAAERTQGALEQLKLRERLAKLRDLPLLRGVGVSDEMARLQRQIDRIASEPTEDEVWQEVELARHPERPYTLDYVERMFEDFIELHGDRALTDDKAIVAGLGRFNGRTIALVGHSPSDTDFRSSHSLTLSALIPV